MTRSTAKPIIAVSAMMLCVAALMARGHFHDSRTGYKPIATVEDLMELGKMLGGTLKADLKEGTDFNEIAHNSRLLAEIGNVLTFQQPETEADWQTHAGRFRVTARRIASAAEAQDIDKARTSHGELMTTCKPCHNKYR